MDLMYHRRNLTTGDYIGQRPGRKPAFPPRLGLLGCQRGLGADTDFSRRFSRCGIAPVQFRILETCFRGEANTVTGLGRVIVLDPGGISRQAEQLR